MKQSSDTIAEVGPSFLSMRGRVIILISALVTLGFAFYGKPLYALGVAVLDRHDSSHGLFVPFISGYLVWLKLDKTKQLAPKAAFLPGCAMAATGGVFFILGLGNESIAMPVLSYLLMSGGLVLMLFGSQVFKEIAFPLFFLVAMIPLPKSLYIQMSEWMRQASTWGAVALLRPLEIPLFRDGFDIYLPNSHLVVDYGCSGIRYLLSYMVFGVAYAFRYKQSFKGRALVVIGALPLSIVGGVLRLSVIFISCYFIGPIMVEHRPHVLLSWTVFTVLLVGVIAIDQYLTKKKVS